MAPLKYILWDLASSGLPKNYDIDVLRKIILSNLMIFLGSFFLLLLSVLAFFQRYYLLGIIDLFFLSFITCLLFYLRETKNIGLASGIGTLTTGGFYAFLIASGSGNNTAVIWSLTFPLIAIFLLGIRRGTPMSAVLLIFSIGVFYLGYHVDYLPVYKMDLILRFVTTYITLYLFALVMEKVRKTVQDRLELANTDLKSVNQEKEALIQKLKATMAEVKQLSIIDPLTGLHNRRHFEAEAAREIKRAQRVQTPLSIVMMDIDHFKKVNDSHGHICGDHVLARVAAICLRTLRSTDLHGRYGGEEFVFLLPGTHLRGARKLAERLRKACAGLIFKKNGRSFSVTASFGIYERRGEENALETFIERSDDALYEAKKYGRNCTVAWSHIPTASRNAVS